MVVEVVRSGPDGDLRPNESGTQASVTWPLGDKNTQPAAAVDLASRLFDLAALLEPAIRLDWIRLSLI